MLIFGPWAINRSRMYRVGTRIAFLWIMRSTASSSRYDPCSIVPQPARRAAMIPGFPWQCAAAVDVRTRNSSLVDHACEMNPEADEVPDPRETRNQSAVCIGDTPCGQDRKGGLCDVLNVRRPDSHEVTMAVPQARHDDRDMMYASPGGRLRGSLDRSREGDRGTVEDHATVPDRLPPARDQEVCFDACHDGRQRLRVNEDSGWLSLPTGSEDKPFRHAHVPRAGRDHGPREEPVELSSGGETHHRRPPVLRSGRFGGLRPS